MIYGLILIPLWLIQMVLGLIFYALAYLRDETLYSFCPTNLDPSRFAYYDQVSQLVKGSDEIMLALASNYMCSEICPCPVESAQLFEIPSSMGVVERQTRNNENYI